MNNLNPKEEFHLNEFVWPLNRVTYWTYFNIPTDDCIRIKNYTLLKSMAMPGLCHSLMMKKINPEY